MSSPESLRPDWKFCPRELHCVQVGVFGVLTRSMLPLILLIVRSLQNLIAGEFVAVPPKVIAQIP